jgi:hypothetical protein
MKRLLMILIAVIGFGICANAQHITATIDGQDIVRKAEKKGANSYIAPPVAIVYNEHNGTATIAYLKGKKFYLGETTAVLKSSNTGIHTMEITRKCNLYYLGDNFNEAALSRLLDFDVAGKGDYYSCSNFKVEW